MLSVFTTIALFVVIIGITAVLFAVWVLVTIARVLGRLASGGRSGNGPALRANGLCAVPGCLTANPAGARFCRRCGHPLAALNAPPSAPFRPRPRQRMAMLRGQL